MSAPIASSPAIIAKKYNFGSLARSNDIRDHLENLDLPRPEVRQQSDQLGLPPGKQGMIVQARLSSSSTVGNSLRNGGTSQFDREMARMATNTTALGATLGTSSQQTKLNQFGTQLWRRQENAQFGLNP